MSEKYRVKQNQRGFFYPQWKNVFGKWKNFYCLYDTVAVFHSSEKAEKFIRDYLKTHKRFLFFNEKVDIIRILYDTSYINKKEGVEDTNYEKWVEE